MKRIIAMLALFAATPAFAQVTVTEAWARSTVSAQKVTGAFMNLQSSQGATLVGADSPAAGRVEIHEMSMQGDMARMRAIDRLELPAGKPVKLAPGGYHLMLFDLKRPLNGGDIVPITLRFEGGGPTQSVEVKAAVR